MMINTLIAVLLLAAAGTASAAPGAHGPGGEHLDTLSPGAAASAQPHLEAKSESFELVARLEGGQLSILVDRFETNEPVLSAKLEVESEGLKGTAGYRADQGSYVVEDPALLKALAKPGQHPVVFTLVVGNESDLLEGMLAVADTAHEHRQRPAWHYAAAIVGGLLLLGLALAYLVRKRMSGRHATQLATLIACTCLATLALAGPGAHGPGGEHLDAPGAATGGSGLARLPDGSVNVPKPAQRRMQIRTLLAPLQEAAATVELPGRVVMDPNAGGRIQPVHGGRIEAGPRGLPMAGQAVRKGEVLAYLRHHAEPFAVANQQSQLSELRAARQIAEQRVLRLESLEGTVARKDIDAARTELTSLAARERSVGVSLDSREALIAPMNGVIARADAVSGQVVEARDTLFEIVDPERILVEATTSDVAMGSRLGAAHLRDVPGVKLEFLGAARSLRDGVLPVSFRARPEKAGSAIPLALGQPVTVIASLKEQVKGIVLPATSVVRGPANEPVVWIKVGAQRFVPQPVEVRALDAQTVLVVRGLAADNRVVVQGAPMIAQIR